MRMPEDKVKQAQVSLDRAIAKRQLAQKLWDEAEEEMLMANILIKDAQLEEAAAKRKILIR